MKKFLVILSVLVFAAALTAQVRTGNIYGKITDTEGNPLPGVSVTLKGSQIAPMTTVTGATGVYRFVSLGPGLAYEIAAELTGFKKSTKTGIIVQVASNVPIDLILEVGTLEEQITVVALSPIVDTKKTTVGQNIDKEAMQSLPTARDPWVMVQLAPAVMVDRENVGGNESGQQSGFIGKGDTSGARISGNQGANNIWSVDGIDITDPAALGGSALYYDFDMFEELNVTTGGAADVSIQTGGIALNMVTRRGGNRMSLAGRFYLTDNFFQTTNLTDDLIARGVLDTNKIQQIKDFGFNVGGPIIKDKLWFWGAYGVQDIFSWTIPSRPISSGGVALPIVPAAENKALLNNYNFKLNAQILANNRFEALVTSGAKEAFGRNASAEKPGGDHQTGKYHWGSPIVKLQDEHVFGNNFYLSLKYSFNDAGFGWRPIPDEGLLYPITYSQTQGRYVPYNSASKMSWGSYGVERPRNNYQLQATYFNDTFLNVSHEVKVGAEYSHKTQGFLTGNLQGYDVYREYSSVQLDTNASGTRDVAEMLGWQQVRLYRRSAGLSVAQQWAAYVQDTIVKGNFTLSLGLRFDKQWPGGGAYTRDAVFGGTQAWDTVFDTAVTANLDTRLPDVDVKAVSGIAQIVTGEPRPYQWNTFSPRIGLTWDVTGDGKTVAKLALSQYGDIMGVGWSSATPFGTGGGLRYWWNDGNGVTPNKDGKMQFNEMYWAYSDRQAAGTRYVPYRVYDDAGNLSVTATAMLAGGYDSDAYVAGGYYSYDFLNPDAEPDYTRGITTYYQNRAAQSSSRTREILLTLERELLPDFSVAVNLTYRRFDKDQISLTYYPAEHAADYPLYTGPEVIDPRTPPAGGWYVEAGTIPDTYIIGGTWALVGGVYVNTGGTTYSSGDAAGRPYYLPGPNVPTTSTRFSLVRKADNYYDYYGVDFVFNKRLSNKWMMNASVTLQDQKTHWGTDFFNPTNQWAFDGKSYGDWGGGASGKTSVLMYTRWMVKLSGLYQLPWGFNVSGTFNAREGWKIPNYFNLYDEGAPNYAAGTGVRIDKQNDLLDSMPTFYNITFRIEKKINVGAGRLYFMADVMNLLNSNMGIRGYSKYDGDARYRSGTVVEQQTSYTYPFNGLWNEVLNPRIWRFGARFEF
jgi:hypothetical protein